MSECSPFFTALSPIAGRGLFANRYFPEGTPLLKVVDQNGNITINAHFIKPVDATTSPVSKPPVLLDPVGSDVPGGVCSVALK